MKLKKAHGVYELSTILPPTLVYAVPMLLLRTLTSECGSYSNYYKNGFSP